MGARLLRVAIRRGCRGERREARAQWAQPPKAVSDPEFRQTTSGTHGSAGRADCLPRGKPPVRPQAHTPAPVGIGAPTPARIGTCRPMGRSHFSFGGERKVCKRKPAARRLREKALYAHFGGGARYVARIIVGQLTHAIVRARSSPFSAVKMGGPFSLRCLSPLCFGAVGVGQTYPLRVGCFGVA